MSKPVQTFIIRQPRFFWSSLPRTEEIETWLQQFASD